MCWKEIDVKYNVMLVEVDGCGGLELICYDDWEIKGLIVDF